jgi:hypothetical protein
MIKNETVAEPETFELVLPDEPPVGSVVIDRYGRAWQRLGGSLFGLNWHVTGRLASFIPALDDAPMLRWGYLLLQRGPVTLVHNPKADEARIERGPRTAD